MPKRGYENEKRVHTCCEARVYLMMMMLRKIHKAAHGVSRYSIEIGKKPKVHVSASSNTRFMPNVGRDVAAILDEAPTRSQAKLHRPLDQSNDKNEASSHNDGILEATALDIMDNMNAALASEKLSNIFRKVGPTSEVLEISFVKINRDCSHVDASWSSSALKGFVENLYSNSACSAKELHLAQKMTKNITHTLQKNESKFRSYLLKHINFRRVPRMFFQPQGALTALLQRFEAKTQLHSNSNSNSRR